MAKISTYMAKSKRPWLSATLANYAGIKVYMQAVVHLRRLMRGCMGAHGLVKNVEVLITQKGVGDAKVHRHGCCSLRQHSATAAANLPLFVFLFASLLVTVQDRDAAMHELGSALRRPALTELKDGREVGDEAVCYFGAMIW